MKALLCNRLFPPGAQGDSLGCWEEGLTQPGLGKKERGPDEGLKYAAYTKPPSPENWEEA